MQDSHHPLTTAADRGHTRTGAVPVSRRRFVGATAGALAIAPLHAAAQSTPETEQPVATPAREVLVDLDRLAQISLAIVGGGTLADAAVETLGGLISADPDRVTAFKELATLDDLSAEGALDDASREARDLGEEIAGFWYLGQFDGNPVENRAELFFGLPVWGTLPYITQPTLCKSFGYWAMDVSLD